VDYWQDRIPFHPLTCGNDSEHMPLRAREVLVYETETVELYCTQCYYRQDFIPESVYDAWRRRHIFIYPEKEVEGEE
jgi:hypothetical protein